MPIWRATGPSVMTVRMPGLPVSVHKSMVRFAASTGVDLHIWVSSRKTAPMLPTAQGLIDNGMVPL